MEKKTLNEIKRFRELMGIKTKLNEWPELFKWVDNFAPTAFKQFDELLKTMAAKDWDDPLKVQNFVNRLKKGGNFSDQELKELTDLLKNNVEIREIVKNTDNFYDDLAKKYQLSEPPGLETLKSLSKLTQSQVDEMTELFLKTITDAMDNVGNPINGQYEDIVSSFGKQLDSTTNKLSSADDIYSTMEERFMYALNSNYKNGNINKSQAEALMDKFSSKIRTEPRIKAKIDNLKSKGLVGDNVIKTKPKFTVTDEKFASNFSAIDDVVDDVVDAVADVVDDAADTVVSADGKITREVPGSSGFKKPTESLDDVSTQRYKDIIGKNENELTPLEKEFKETVEKWKNGDKVDVANLNKKIEKAPDPDTQKYIDDLKAKETNDPNSLTKKEKDLLDKHKEWESGTVDDNLDFKSIKKEIETDVTRPTTTAQEKIDELLKKNYDELTKEEKALVDEYNNWKSGETTGTPDWKKLEDNARLTALPPEYDGFGNNMKTTIDRYNSKFKNNIVTRSFADFYNGVLRPLYRIFISTIDTIVNDVLFRIRNQRWMNAKDVFDIFENEMGKVINRFKSRGGISRGDISKVKEMLTSLKGKKGTTGGFDLDRFTRKELWEKFKANARKQLSGSPNDLDDFNKFVEAFEAGGDNPTLFDAKLSEIFNDGVQPIKKTGDNEVIDANKAFDKAKKAWGEGFKNLFDTSSLIPFIFKGLYTAIDGLLNVVLTGFFKTPKQAQLYFLKQGYTTMAALKQVMMSFIYSKVLLPVGVALATAFYYGEERLEGIRNDVRSKYGSDGEYFFNELIYNPIIDGLTSIGPVSEFYSGYSGWQNFMRKVIPGFVDDTIISFFTGVKASGEEGGQTIPEKENDKAIDNLNKELEADYSDVNKKESMEVELQPTKNAAIRVLDKKNSQFFNSLVEYIPEVPKDYLIRVNEKLKEAGSEVKVTNISDMQKMASTDKTGILSNADLRGSIVVKGKSGDKYLVLGKNRNNPTITMDAFTNDFTQEIMWVKPKFDDLNINSTREYYTLKEFINQYNKL